MNNHNDERISVVFFENADGYIIVAPDQSHPTPEGYERKTCTSLRAIDALTRSLNRQDSDMYSHMMEKDRASHLLRMQPVKDRLRQRLDSPECSPIERTFIQSAFAYFQRKEQELFKFEMRGYFMQREFDSKTDPHDDPGRQIPIPKMSDRLANTLGRG